MKATHHRDSEFPREQEWLCWRRPHHCCRGSPALRGERTTSLLPWTERDMLTASVASLPLPLVRAGTVLFHKCPSWVSADLGQVWDWGSMTHWVWDCILHHPPTQETNLVCPKTAHGNLEDKIVQTSLSRLKTLKASVSLILAFKWGDAGHGSSTGTFGKKHIWLFATPWTPARSPPLSLGFSRQDYWSG